MKTIKIFLASSEELDYDRMVFGNLVRRLDDMYEKRGIRIKLFEWEDYDSAYNDKRKQDEYNDYVRQSVSSLSEWALTLPHYQPRHKTVTGYSYPISFILISSEPNNLWLYLIVNLQS